MSFFLIATSTEHCYLRCFLHAAAHNASSYSVFKLNKNSLLLGFSMQLLLLLLLLLSLVVLVLVLVLALVVLVAVAVVVAYRHPLRKNSAAERQIFLQLVALPFLFEVFAGVILVRICL